MKRRAVILAAGRGARLHPLTACVPKELLPIAFYPALHHVIAEAETWGVTEALVILSEGKEAVKDYFASEARPKGEFAARLEEKRARLTRNVKVSFAYQKCPLGTGDAILVAKDFAAGAPILVMYPDDILGLDLPQGFRFFGAAPEVEKLWLAASKGVSSVMARKVPGEKAKDYGVIYPARAEGALFPVRKIVEKPSHHGAEAALALVGRMVLCPSVLDSLERLPRRDDTGVIPALNAEAEEGRLFASALRGEISDIGSHEGYLCASVEAASLLKDRSRAFPN